MYSHIGKKIKFLAGFFGILIFLIGLIMGIILLKEASDAYTEIEKYLLKREGWNFIVIGLIGFVATWVLYAYGQLVDDVHELRDMSEQRITTTQPDTATTIYGTKVRTEGSTLSADSAANADGGFHLPEL